MMKVVIVLAFLFRSPVKVYSKCYEYCLLYVTQLINTHENLYIVTISVRYPG